MGATSPTHWCECAHKHKFDAKPPSSPRSRPFHRRKSHHRLLIANANARACARLHNAEIRSHCTTTAAFPPPQSSCVCGMHIYSVRVCDFPCASSANCTKTRRASFLLLIFFRCSHCWRPSRRADEQQQRVAPSTRALAAKLYRFFF